MNRRLMRWLGFGMLLFSSMEPVFAGQLHRATYDRNFKEVSRLLREGVNINALNDEGDSPLHIAARYHNVEMAILLLNEGANINIRDRAGNSPLHIAVSSGSVKLAQVLVEHKAQTASRNKLGRTPLHDVSSKDTCSLGLGAKIPSPYMYIGPGCGGKGLEEIVSLLLSSKADIGARDKRGMTPLHLAAKKGNLDSAGVILAHKCNINSKDNFGNTPLHYASTNNIAFLLLDKGSDVSIKNSYGRTMLNKWAASPGVEDTKLLERLLDEKPEISSVDNLGMTPLHWSAFFGKLEFTRVLLIQGADPGFKNNRGKNPAALAAENNHTEVFELLELAALVLNAHGR